MIKSKNSIRGFLATVCLAGAFVQPAFAVEVGGISMDDTARVANKDLKLNGAGVRTKAIFKVYALGLYLPEKKTAVADILALQGPRRISIVLLREISTEDFGQAFMSGLNANSDKTEKTNILNQTMQFGEMFAMIPGLKKGDVLVLDYGRETQANSTLAVLVDFEAAGNRVSRLLAIGEAGQAG